MTPQLAGYSEMGSPLLCWKMKEGSGQERSPVTQLVLRHLEAGAPFRPLEWHGLALGGCPARGRGSWWGEGRQVRECLYHDLSPESFPQWWDQHVPALRGKYVDLMGVVCWAGMSEIVAIPEGSTGRRRWWPASEASG